MLAMAFFLYRWPASVWLALALVDADSPYFELCYYQANNA
jgi:hypothetical protein